MLGVSALWFSLLSGVVDMSTSYREKKKAAGKRSEIQHSAALAFFLKRKGFVGKQNSSLCAMVWMKRSLGYGAE